MSQRAIPDARLEWGLAAHLRPQVPPEVLAAAGVECPQLAEERLPQVGVLGDPLEVHGPFAGVLSRSLLGDALQRPAARVGVPAHLVELGENLGQGDGSGLSVFPALIRLLCQDPVPA